MRAGVAALALLSLFTLTGCWNNRPIESRAIVLVLGVDPGPDNRLILSLQVPSPSALQSLTGSSPPKKPTSFVITGDGKTFSEALNAAQVKSEHEIYLGQLQAVVLSMRLPDSQFKTVEDFLTRYGPTDKSAYLVATQQKASDILTAEPRGARFAALYLHTLFSCQTCQVAHLERMVWDQEKMRLCPVDSGWMPIISSDGEFHVDKVAIYEKTHPALILSPAETITLAHILGLTHKAVETLPTRWGEAGLQSVQATPSTETRLEGGKLTVDVTLKVTASLDSFPLGAATLNNIRDLEALLSQRVAQRSTVLLAKLQSQGLNPVRFGEAVLWHHPELAATWPNLYHNAQIKVHVSSQITDVGDAT